MPKPKLSVAVGIPAYNEEKNITLLLKQVLRQKGDSFRLKEIIVASDNSTDQTVSLVKSIKDKRIKVINGKKQLGKSGRVNQMFARHKSDIFVQFDADTTLISDTVIEELAKPFTKKQNLGLVMGWHIPLPPKTFVGKCVAFGAKVWGKALDDLGRQAYLFRAVGNIRAFSKKYTKNHTIADTFGEDRYSYMVAVTNGYHVAFAKKAVVGFKVADNFQDFVHQMHRFLKSPFTLEEYFDAKDIQKHMPKMTKPLLKNLIIESLKNPVLGIGYVSLHTIPKVMIAFDKKDNGIWKIATSTR